MAPVATTGFNHSALVWPRHKMPLDYFSRTEILGLMQSTDTSISMPPKFKCSATEKAVQKSFEERAMRKHSDWASFAPFIITPRRRGLHKELGGDTGGIAEPSWLQGYSTPHGVMLSTPSWGKERETHVWTGVCPPQSPSHGCCPAFLQLAEHLPDHGKQYNNSLFCFACVCAFCLIYQTYCLSLSQSRSFHIFTVPILPLNLLGGKWLSGSVMLSCWLGLNMWHSTCCFTNHVFIN